jgi:hypothetical protein
MDTPGNLVDSPTHRCGESIFEYEYLREFEAGKSNGLKGRVRELGQSDLCKNTGKSGSLPCPFKYLGGSVGTDAYRPTREE